MTMDNIPEVINVNQFYVFHRKTGKVSIGTIIGKSAVTNISYYQLDGMKYKLHPSHALTTENPITKFENNVIGYMYREDLIKEYEKFLEMKEKRKKTYKTHYAVDVSLFTCKTTKTTNGYGLKYFDTKEEALTYANKGLVRVKKVLKDYLNKFIELKAIIDEIDKSVVLDDLKDFIVKPSTLNVNDLLIKVDAKSYKHIYTGIVKDDGVVTVKGFVSPEIVNLSDGTILIENECRYSTLPCFIKYKDKDLVKKILFVSAIKRTKRDVEHQIENIKKVSKFIETYVPFQTKAETGIHFSKDYDKELIEGIIECLKENSNLNNYGNNNRRLR